MTRQIVLLVDGGSSDPLLFDIMTPGPAEPRYLPTEPGIDYRMPAAD